MAERRAAGRGARKGARKAPGGAARAGKPRWRTLQHNGILFPPPYEPKGLPVTIRGKEVALGPLQEEMAYQWAKKKDTPYAQDPVFQRNFARDFAAALGGGHGGLSYGEIGFERLYRLVDRERDARELLSKEARKELAARRKAVREEMKARYGTAVLDGKPVDVGNYMAEPPGIFIGRGEHPLRGRWKRRVTHADVTLNLGREAEPPPGGWKAVVSNRAATWLASWTDDLTGATKYVWLADNAGLKQQSDRAKYDKAAVLSKEIGRVRSRIVADMVKGDGRGAEVATACYLIYRTAMRVGDEKDSDEADTVGATTLRREHVRVGPGGIEFDFLGKDSVRWRETVPAEGDDAAFRDVMERLVASKRPKDEIFGGITSRHVNAYYSGIVKGLSAKVFRTYLASRVVAAHLRGAGDARRGIDAEKLHRAKLANLEAAKMCNHKRTIPKTFEKSLERKREALRKARAAAVKTPKQKRRRAERVKKLRLQLSLAEETRDYNLGTSLRNYIDPRIFKAWTDEAGLPWEKLYTAALQRKFGWVAEEKEPWAAVSKTY